MTSAISAFCMESVLGLLPGETARPVEDVRGDLLDRRARGGSEARRPRGRRGQGAVRRRGTARDPGGGGRGRSFRPCSSRRPYRRRVRRARLPPGRRRLRRCLRWRGRPRSPRRRTPDRARTREVSLLWNSIPKRPARRISEWQTLFPSPTYASRTPESVPKRSRRVIASASACRGVALVGEAVDHGDRGVLGELLDLRLLERPDHQCREETGKDERRVAVRLAARELELGCGEEQGHPAELRDSDLESDARSGRGLVEDEADRPPGEDAELAATRALGLELVGQVEQRREALLRSSSPLA